MIASGYTMMLYCDCPTCSKKFIPFIGEFVSKGKSCYSDVRKAAARAGWKMNDNETKCFSPGHKEE
jgi:hypothetical protein